MLSSPITVIQILFDALVSLTLNFSISGSTRSNGRPFTLTVPLPLLQWATAVAVFYQKYEHDFMPLFNRIILSDLNNNPTHFQNTTIFHIIHLDLDLSFVVKVFQGGHILAEMKFPVFSLSFPCVTWIFPVLFLRKN